VFLKKFIKLLLRVTVAERFQILQKEKIQNAFRVEKTNSYILFLSFKQLVQTRGTQNSEALFIVSSVYSKGSLLSTVLDSWNALTLSNRP